MLLKPGKRWFLLIVAGFVILMITLPEKLMSFNNTLTYQQVRQSQYVEKDIKEDLLQGRWRRLTEEQKDNLSPLGRILYLDEEPPKVNKSRNYTILLWKYGKTLEPRHIYHFSKTKFDPLKKCSVNNCRFTYDNSNLGTADLVIFHMHRIGNVSELPHKNRNTKQLWAFLTDESPHNTFLGRNYKIESFNGIFNWSMTYRMDSNIPVPYGRTVVLPKEDTKWPRKIVEWQKQKRKDVLVAVMGSNCGGRNHRWNYVRQLQKYINIDIYGRCGTLKCLGHFGEDCPKLSQYKFYLSFENSNCDEYVTEKVWWNAYAKNAIPIVMGSSKATYEQLLPPKSYIDVDDFATPRDLANYITFLNSSDEIGLYLQWKRHFKVLNEHGYFHTDSFHYCRACEALNYNSKKKHVYGDLNTYWKKNKCREAWDTK